MTKTIVYGFAMIVALSACGGGGESTAVAPPLLSPAPPGSFNAQVNSETLRLNQLYNADRRLNLTPTANMPTEGSAIYTGTASFSETGGRTTFTGSGSNFVVTRTVPDLIATATITANFGTSIATGSIGNFIDSTNTPRPGNLVLGGAEINGHTIRNGPVSGTFPVNGEARTVQSLAYSAEFVGANAESMSGFAAFFAPTPEGGVRNVTGQLTLGQSQ